MGAAPAVMPDIFAYGKNKGGLGVPDCCLLTQSDHIPLPAETHDGPVYKRRVILGRAMNQIYFSIS